jgi:hypothetical protein
MKDGFQTETKMHQETVSPNGGLTVGNFSLFKRHFHRDLLDDRQNQYGNLG